MCQILVFAKNNTNPNPNKDRRGCYKRGYCVAVFDDNHIWGTEEGLPKFVIMKIPTISKTKALKYIKEQFVGQDADKTIYRRRLWQIRWDDLPQYAKDRLKNDGEIIIKAGTYDGIYDYAWTQVKTYFRNLETGLDETEDL